MYALGVFSLGSYYLKLGCFISSFWIAGVLLSLNLVGGGSTASPASLPATHNAAKDARACVLSREATGVNAGACFCLARRRRTGAIHAILVTQQFSPPQTAHMLGAACMGVFWQQLAGVGHDLGALPAPPPCQCLRPPILRSLISEQEKDG